MRKNIFQNNKSQMKKNSFSFNQSKKDKSRIKVIIIVKTIVDQKNNKKKLITQMNNQNTKANFIHNLRLPPTKQI